MAINKISDIRALERLEHQRDLLLAFHANAIETFSDMQHIILTATGVRAANSILHAGLRPNVEMAQYLRAVVIDGVCDLFSGLQKAEEVRHARIHYRESGWENTIRQHVVEYPREVITSAVSHGRQHALETARKEVFQFYEDVFFDCEDEQDRQEERIQNISVAAFNDYIKIDQEHLDIASNVCATISEMGKTYAILKRADDVIGAIKLWEESNPPENRPPFRARPVARAFLAQNANPT